MSNITIAPATDTTTIPKWKADDIVGKPGFDRPGDSVNTLTSSGWQRERSTHINTTDNILTQE